MGSEEFKRSHAHHSEKKTGDLELRMRMKDYWIVSQTGEAM